MTHGDSPTTRKTAKDIDHSPFDPHHSVMQAGCVPVLLPFLLMLMLDNSVYLSSAQPDARSQEMDGHAAKL